MTDDELKELNELLATKILGWEKYRFALEDWWLGTGDERKEGVRVRVGDWSPTTRYDHVMMVAEALRKKGYSACIVMASNETPVDMRYDVGFTKVTNYPSNGYAIGSSLFLVICLAAKQVVESEATS